MKPKRAMYRQGDVLVERVAGLPDGLRVVPLEGGNVILAHGEATGHWHGFTESAAALLETESGEHADRYLQLDEPAVLRHAEHAPIELPAGIYRVRRQREYSPEEVRNVAD